MSSPIAATRTASRVAKSSAGRSRPMRSFSPLETALLAQLDRLGGDCRRLPEPQAVAIVGRHRARRSRRAARRAERRRPERARPRRPCRAPRHGDHREPLVADEMERLAAQVVKLRRRHPAALQQRARDRAAPAPGRPWIRRCRARGKPVRSCPSSVCEIDQDQRPIGDRRDPRLDRPLELEHQRAGFERSQGQGFELHRLCRLSCGVVLMMSRRGLCGTVQGGETNSPLDPPRGRGKTPQSV